MGKKAHLTPTVWILFALIAGGLFVVGLNWDTLAKLSPGATSDTEIQISVLDAHSHALLPGATVAILGIDTTNMTAEQKSAIAPGNMTLLGTNVTGDHWTPLENWVYVGHAGYVSSYSDSWQPLIVGNNSFYILASPNSLRLAGHESASLSTVVAGSTWQDWVLEYSCRNGTGFVNESTGYMPRYNLTSQKYDNWGSEYNEGPLLRVTFANAPASTDVSVAGQLSAEVVGNSVFLHLNIISGRGTLNAHFSGNLATLGLQSFALVDGSALYNTALAAI